MLELRVNADKSGGEESRTAAGWPIRDVELVGEAPALHNFADTFISRGLGAGFLEFESPRAVTSGQTAAGERAYSRDPVITGDTIVLHLAQGDLRYLVLEHPGMYPDPDEPSGFRISHEYKCELEGLKKKGGK